MAIIFKRNTAALWTSTNPVLGSGEQGVETDTGKTKIGDGVTAWNSLSYYGAVDVEGTPVQTSTTTSSYGALVTLPPVGGYGTIPGVISYGFGSQSSGVMYFHPFWVGPVGWTANAFRTRIIQARVGGTGAIRKFALYPDAGGYPDTTPANRLAVATIDDTVVGGANGDDYAFSGGAVALQPGLYWCGSFNYAVTSPSVQSNILQITNIVYGLPTDNINAPDAVVRSLSVGSLTDIPSSKLAQSAFGSYKGNETPALLLRRSA